MNKYKVRVLQDGDEEVDFIDYIVSATTPEDAQQLAFALDGGWGSDPNERDASNMLSLAQSYASVENLSALSEPKKEEKVCEKCGDRRTIKVLGSGGDYEDWPCPECRKPEWDRGMATIY